MSRFWTENDLDGPRKLMNRDNAATATVNPGTQAADHALAQSQGGIVKLTSLAGALFLHKDKKKGQQDSYLIYFEKIYSYSIPFPNTSNTRYQSYYRAATVLINYREDILDFLCQIAHRKETGKLNHLEQNVYDGLNDLPTLTEMCAAVHYSLAIAIPYMRAVRSYSTDGTNVLDLGPFHRNLLIYTAYLVDHPELLLASDASWGPGTFDGTLEGVLVAALRGALETWKRFTSEFVEGGLIDSLTPAVRKLVFLLPTNDLNEGGFGQRRQASIHSPFMTNLQFNARRMYRTNSTRLWMCKTLTPSDHIYLRKISCKVGGSQLARQQRMKQADYDRRTATKKKLQIAEARARKERSLETICGINLIEITAVQVPVQQCRVSDADLKKQLTWYRRIGGDVNIPAYSKLKKAQLMEEVRKAIDRWSSPNGLAGVPMIDSVHRADVDEAEEDLDN